MTKSILGVLVGVLVGNAGVLFWLSPDTFTGWYLVVSLLCFVAVTFWPAKTPEKKEEA